MRGCLKSKFDVEIHSGVIGDLSRARIQFDMQNNNSTEFRPGLGVEGSNMHLVKTKVPEGGAKAPTICVGKCALFVSKDTHPGVFFSVCDILFVCKIM